MKKLFISVPMKGRTEENIEKSKDFMHKYAELITGEELEVIKSTITLEQTFDYGKKSVYCLGESIRRMSKADYVVGINYGSDMWHGCDIEQSVARDYGIPFFAVDWERIPVFHDMYKVRNDYWEGLNKANTCEAVR